MSYEEAVRRSEPPLPERADDITLTESLTVKQKRKMLNPPSMQIKVD